MKMAIQENRLAHEQSPYLLQHAHNPVDWYPWGDEAFYKARSQDKPVFLSIGYSTCHWCHVMERESFENAEVASILNRDFVSIKVDREERPDIDQVYMTAAQAMGGGNGWPLSVFLTPDRKPFFAGTYFPPEDQTGRQGFKSILVTIAEAWKTDRAHLVAHADRVIAAVADDKRRTKVSLDEQIIKQAAQEFARRFDPSFGGFSSGTKFPMGHALSFLLRCWYRSRDQGVLKMVTYTLEQMARGGIYDHLAGGFHRYSTERTWLIPHFEKMLYDQALAVRAYAEAYQVTGNPEYRCVAMDTLGYVARYMMHPQGAFYSAEDADSEGEEGKFYVWSRDEIVAALGDDNGDLFCRFYGVTQEGNFERRNILSVALSAKEFNGKHHIDPEDLSRRLEACREKLLKIRDTRVRPLRDDKILTDWNGLMISAFSYVSRAFQMPEYAETAGRAADFVLGELRRYDGRLLRRWRNGHPGGLGLLEDHAFLCNAMIDLYEATFDAKRLVQARELGREMIRLFWDDGAGGFFAGARDGETLVVNPKPTYDGAIPSGNSAALMALARLAHITADSAIDGKVDMAFRAFSSEIAEMPSGFPYMLTALDYRLGPRTEMVIASGKNGQEAEQFASEAFGRFSPRSIVLMLDSGEADLPLETVCPFVKAHIAHDGKATLYMCEDYSCTKPVWTIEGVREVLSESMSIDSRG